MFDIYEIMDNAKVSVLAVPQHGLSVLPPAGAEEGAVASAKRADTSVQAPASLEGKRRGQSDRTSLSPEAQRQLERLRARDREVRAHEMAHLAAAGGYATSGMQLTYETGPDGRQYAVGGEVGIDVSPGRTPEETIAKMQVVQRAALAPAEPSPQDQRVAALAAQQMAQAAVELSRREVGGAEDESATDRQGIGRTAEKRVGKVVNDNPLVAAGIEARQAWQTRLRLQA